MANSVMEWPPQAICGNAGKQVGLAFTGADKYGQAGLTNFIAGP